MVSEKQLLANRLNAQKSTGPRTAAGKAITRLNAVRDGLTGQLTIVPREEYDTYVAFSQTLTADLNPFGPQELHVAARIVRDTWRLHRIAANEENMYTLGLMDLSNVGQSEPDRHGDIILAQSGPNSDPSLAVAISNTRTFFNQPRDFERASLYEQRIKRGLMKDYALFRQLQRDRNMPATKSVARTGRLQPNPPVRIEPDPGYTMFEQHYPHPTKETTYHLNGFEFPKGPKDLYGFPLGLKIEPQVVNKDNPYVSPWSAWTKKAPEVPIQDPYWPF